MFARNSPQIFYYVLQLCKILNINNGLLIVSEIENERFKAKKQMTSRKRLTDYFLTFYPLI